MQKVLVDTDILSEYFKGIDQNVVKNAKQYIESWSFFTFSSVTVYEIIRGLEEKGASRQVLKALDWFNQNEQIVPTAEDYLSSARIKAKARSQGKVIELPDCLIATTASRLGIVLVTGNTSDYQSIQNAGLNLALQNWRNL
jgi:tRNA(fMet)-specific endonuclease VapC